jgi:hypothetical protein
MLMAVDVRRKASNQTDECIDLGSDFILKMPALDIAQVKLFPETHFAKKSIFLIC